MVVSMRSTRPNLSYILIAGLPKRCLMQVPSMRVAKLRADLLGQQRGDLLAQEGGHLLGFDRQHRLARELLVQGPRVCSERNTRSVEYSTCIRLQW